MIMSSLLAPIKHYLSAQKSSVACHRYAGIKSIISRSVSGRELSATVGLPKNEPTFEVLPSQLKREMFWHRVGAQAVSAIFLADQATPQHCDGAVIG